MADILNGEVVKIFKSIVTYYSFFPIPGEGQGLQVLDQGVPELRQGVALGQVGEEEDAGQGGGLQLQGLHVDEVNHLLEGFQGGHLDILFGCFLLGIHHPIKACAEDRTGQGEHKLMSLHFSGTEEGGVLLLLLEDAVGDVGGNLTGCLQETGGDHKIVVDGSGHYEW